MSVKNSLIVQETHYDPWGLELAGIEKIGMPEHRWKFNGGKTERTTDLDLNWDETHYRSYDYQLGRFHQVDPKPDDEDQESLTVYQYSLDNPILHNDPDGDCPLCGLIGAGLGAAISGGIEVASQIAEHGEVTDWKAVGGEALKGGITGGVGGLTGGASLIATVGTSAAANVVGGIVNDKIQGKEITAGSVTKDAVVGVVAGVGGHYVGKAIQGGLDKLSNVAKGKLGEAITQIKYGAQGYKSAGNDVVKTGGKTATGRDAVARFDHKMTNFFTKKQITVESKFNRSGLTTNQRAVINNGYKVTLDRTTSQGLGNGAKAATVGAGAGSGNQINKKPD